MIQPASVNAARDPAAVARRRKDQRRASGMACAFIAPTFVFILAFSYYPAVRVLIGVFTDWDGFNAPTFLGVKYQSNHKMATLY